jgi:hypothetical protein
MQRKLAATTEVNMIRLRSEMTGVVLIAEASMEREGTSPKGYPQYRLHWPRVARVRSNTTYFDPHRLIMMATKLGRPSLHYRFCPQVLRLALWRDPEGLSELDVINSYLPGAWGYEFLVKHDVTSYSVRYNGIGIERDGKAILHSLYVPRPIIGEGEYPQSLMAMICTSDDRMS